MSESLLSIGTSRPSQIRIQVHIKAAMLISPAMARKICNAEPYRVTFLTHIVSFSAHRGPSASVIKNYMLSFVRKWSHMVSFAQSWKHIVPFVQKTLQTCIPSSIFA